MNNEVDREVTVERDGNCRTGVSHAITIIRSNNNNNNVNSNNNDKNDTIITIIIEIIIMIMIIIITAMICQQQRRRLWHGQDNEAERRAISSLITLRS